jgi:hypothetical protein
MPRIPEGQFNTRPSQRVGNISPQAPQASGLDNLTKATGNLTRAFATLQDQTERTDAYNKANEISEQYKERKQNYKLALESATADGTFRYTDPMDDNPDVSKRRVIEGKVSEEMGKLKEFYQTSRESLNELERSDIAGELVDQYVGQDIPKLQFATGKRLIKVKGDTAVRNVLNNTESLMQNMLDLVSDSADPEVTEANLVSSMNQIDRDIAQVSPILNAERTAQARTAKDRIVSRYAGEIIKRNPTEGGVKAAERLVSFVKDPIQKQSAERALKDAKRGSIQRNNNTLITSSAKLSKDIAEAPDMDDMTYKAAVEQVDRLRNMYIDPEHSLVSREQVDQVAADLMSTVVAKRTIVNKFENVGLASLVSSDEAVRGPAAKEIMEEIQGEVTAAGLSSMLESTPEFKETMLAATEQKLASMYTELKRHIPDMVKKKNPNFNASQINAEIERVTELHQHGEPVYASKKDITEFKRDFTSSISNGGLEAFQYFQSKVGSQGEKARAVTIDLIDKNPNLSYLTVAADLKDQGFDIMNDAYRAKIQGKEKGINPTYAVREFAAKKAGTFMEISESPVYMGLRQAIINRATVLAEDKNDFPSALETATEQFSEMYTTLSDVNNEIIALNGADGVNYADPEVKEQLSFAIRNTPRLEGASREDKAKILKGFVKLDPAQVDAMSDEGMSFFLANSLQVKSIDKQTNTVRLMYDNKPITGTDNKAFEFKLKDLVENARVKMQETRQARPRSGFGGVR